jgi:hypothetical protein
MKLAPKVANFLAIFLVMWACLFLVMAFVVADQFREIIIGAVIAAANIIIIWFFRREVSGA